jgi:hypothetical protein
MQTEMLGRCGVGIGAFPEGSLEGSEALRYEGAKLFLGQHKTDPEDGGRWTLESGN